MNRIKKTFLLPVRRFGLKFNLKLYYWADKRIYKLGDIYVMPLWYYVSMFNFYMSLLRFKSLHKIADRGVHTIPYHIRFHAS